MHGEPLRDCGWPPRSSGPRAGRRALPDPLCDLRPSLRGRGGSSPASVGPRDALSAGGGIMKDMGEEIIGDQDVVRDEGRDAGGDDDGAYDRDR